MKKAIVVIVSAICFSGLAFANQLENCCEQNCDFEVVNVCCMTEEQLNAVMQSKCSDVVVEFTKGTILPLSVFLCGDLVSLEKCEGQVEIKQTFYVTWCQDELMFSTDLCEWKTFCEFATGTASASLGFQDGQPCLTAGAETNLR